MKEITIKVVSDLETQYPVFKRNLKKLTQKHRCSITEVKFASIDSIPRKQRLSHDEFVRLSEEISQRIGPVKTNCAEYIREMRDQR